MDENNNEDDAIRQYLEQHAKRIERIVQSRFNSMMDQVNKLASDNQVMAVRIFNLEKVVRSQSASISYMAGDLQFIRAELDALENYLAESDPTLKAIIDSTDAEPPQVNPPKL
jgi:hypothetical protein